ncbi:MULTISPECIES: DUF4097 family beta strand repeat-containing protein [Thermomonosporaceae]|uniref:DUF4097 family beta strand repeat-containing protein n=1 Tax=Thermomonosporaceae TaxID=2012 RepID=UPI00255A9303|nr:MULTISPECIES: DUF4097 family beta strand repeat-containing protein [Thermomonosporaceae]MDL4775714.1 DUF4097 family beta strand repeat-containing protein [Actinomadura xylanilytica]
MRKLKGTAVPAGAVAVSAVAAAALLAGCGLNVGTRHEDRSYNAPAGITALKVGSGTGRIEIVASDSPAIKVRERLSWSNDGNKPVPQHVTRGDALSLSATCARTVLGDARCGISYRVQVPRATSVQVEGHDGPVSVAGLTGTVRISTDDGPITAGDLRTTSLIASSGDGAIEISGRAGTADVRTDAGPITATGLTADRLTARTGDGAIRLTGRATTADLHTDTGPITASGLTADRLTARTGDGAVRLGLASAPGTVDVKTDIGRVRLFLPGGQGYLIDLTSDTGAKRVDPAVHQDSRSPRHVTVTTGDGAITVSPA